jgi:hypothetical protein
VDARKHSPLPATRVHIPLSTTRPSQVPNSFSTALNSHLIVVAAPKADVVTAEHKIRSGGDDSEDDRTLPRALDFQAPSKGIPQESPTSGAPPEPEATCEAAIKHTIQGEHEEAQPVAGDPGSHPPVDDTPIAGAYQLCDSLELTFNCCSCTKSRCCHGRA